MNSPKQSILIRKRKAKPIVVEEIPAKQEIKTKGSKKQKIVENVSESTSSSDDDEKLREKSIINKNKIIPTKINKEHPVLVEILKELKDNKISCIHSTQKGTPHMVTVVTEDECDIFVKLLAKCYHQVEEKNEDEKVLAKRMVVGFDAEFSRDDKVQTIQLSCGLLSAVVQVGVMGSIPESLFQFLSSSKVVLTGVGVHEDCRAIRSTFSDRGFYPGNCLDVALLAMTEDITKGYRSLGVLSKDILRYQKGTSSGGWGKRFLNYQQVKYATMDAWMGYGIARFMFENLNTDEKKSFYKWCKAKRTTERELHKLVPHKDFMANNKNRGFTKSIERRQKHIQNAKKGSFRNKIEEAKKLRQHNISANQALEEVMANLNANNGGKKKKSEDTTSTTTTSKKKKKSSKEEEDSFVFNIL